MSFWTRTRIEFVHTKTRSQQQTLTDLQIIEFHVYVLEDPLQKRYRRLGEHSDVTYRALNAKEVIDFEMEHRKGRTVISCTYCLSDVLASTYYEIVCTNDEMNDAIRRLVQSRAGDAISLKELDFRPEKG